MNIIDARLNRLSEIFMDIGQVCLASITLPFILDQFDINKVFIGLFFSLIFWTASILSVKIKT